MDRRTFTGLFSMGVLGSGLPSSGSAYGRCSVATDELERGLSKFPSRAIGPQHHEKIAYVLVSPWCIPCSQLVSDALEGKLNFSVRALPSGLRNDDHINKATSFILDDNFQPMDFFGRPTGARHEAALKKRVESASRYMTLAVEEWGRRFRDLGPGTPVWASRQFDGFNTFQGYSSRQTGFWNNYFDNTMVSTPIEPDINAMALSRRFLTSGFQGEQRNSWHSKSSGERKLRVLPVEGSLSPECSTGGTRLAGEARFSFGGDRWVLFRGQLRYSGNRSGWFDAYGKEEDFPFEGYAS